jgi:5-methylcytosine-specific restriction endonuclease McrA
MYSDLASIVASIGSMATKGSWLTETKTCLHCGTEFTPDPRQTYAAWDARKFCGRQCALLHGGGRPVTRMRLTCGQCGKIFEIERHRAQTARFCSMRCKGLYQTGRRGGPPVTRVTVACRQCGAMFEVKRYRTETAHYCSKECLWASRDRGSVSPERRIRYSPQMSAWRQAVFERDDYTCQLCGIRGGVELNADHIKPFALYPELRFDLSNGRTLCVPCHRKTDTFGISLVRKAREEGFS